jgi:hypothetical protein
MTIKKIFLVMFFIPLQAKSDFNCFNPEPNTCNFYQDCVETKVSCGEDGYAIGYGEKYCKNFLALTNDDLSIDAIKWRDATLVCLQKALTPYLSEEVLTCEQVKKEAFDSHAGCYTNSTMSICNLKISDWKKIIDVVGLWSTLFGENSSSQVKEVIKTCSGQLLGQAQELQFALSESQQGSLLTPIDFSQPESRLEMSITTKKYQLFLIQQKLKFIKDLK